MTSRNPKPLESLTRMELAGRIEALRDALDTLQRQAEIDGGLTFECVGRMKVTLFTYRQRLRAMDRGDFTPVPAVVRAALDAQR